MIRFQPKKHTLTYIAFYSCGTFPNASLSFLNIFISIYFFLCWLLPTFKCFFSYSFYAFFSLFRFHPFDFFFVIGQIKKCTENKENKMPIFVPTRFFIFDLTTWSGIICMYLNVSFIANYEYTVCFPCFFFLAFHPYTVWVHAFFSFFFRRFVHQCKYGHRNPNVGRIIKQNETKEKSLTFHERTKWEEAKLLSKEYKKTTKTNHLTENRNECHKHSLFYSREIVVQLRVCWHHDYRPSPFNMHAVGETQYFYHVTHFWLAWYLV